MSVPGSNLLSDALCVIEPQQADYFRHDGRKVNDAGQYVDSYLPPVEIEASIQAVRRTKYQFMGLDFSKSYVSVHACVDMRTLVRDVSGDYFVYNGRKYKLVDQSNWFVQDGWSKGLAIDIGDA